MPDRSFQPQFQLRKVSQLANNLCDFLIKSRFLVILYLDGLLRDGLPPPSDDCLSDVGSEDISCHMIPLPPSTAQSLRSYSSTRELDVGQKVPSVVDRSDSENTSIARSPSCRSGDVPRLPNDDDLFNTYIGCASAKDGDFPRTPSPKQSSGIISPPLEAMQSRSTPSDAAGMYPLGDV